MVKVMRLHRSAQYLILCMALALARLTDGATVSHTSTIMEGNGDQRNGSTEGGTLLWIYGTGFASNPFSIVPSQEEPNTVQLVRGNSIHNCEINSEWITETQLACYTPRLSAGEYQVRVYVEGTMVPLSQYSSPSSATFIASPSNTPQIHSIAPSTGLPRRLVTLRGDFKTSCYSREVYGCWEEQLPVIKRIYIGGHLCNLINSEYEEYYSELNNTQLECFFESDEVGVFNVTMLVSNEFGRSSANADLLKISGFGEIYTLETYGVLSEISSDSGSIEGGTILTLNGEFFINSERYPLIVNVGDEPCTILTSELGTIQCQTSTIPTQTRAHYHGGRGLHIYYQSGFINLANLGSSSPPTPGPSANRMWTAEASLNQNFQSATTVWFIGYFRSPIVAAYYFRIETNSNAVLYLSTDEDPANIVQIGTQAQPNSNRIVLQNNTDYYVMFIVSNQNGNLNAAIKASMQPLNGGINANRPGVTDIQQITIGGNLVYEQQRITYMTNASANGVAEIQDVEVVLEIFQIGFEGAYTALLDGPPSAAYIQDALNDLPTIYPLTVRVALVGTAYRVTFPVEMGNVPLLTVISKAFNLTQTAVVITEGEASGLHIAFKLDGAITTYMNFRDDTITDAMLREEFSNLFKIRCPPSLNNMQAVSSIVYANDFENFGTFDQSLQITDMAFCGRGALRNSGGNLITQNTIYADLMCFAYKIMPGGSITINFFLENDGVTPFYESIPMNLIADSRWHYKCLDLRLTLENHSPFYYTVNVFIILQANVTYSSPSSAMIDTVTLRNGPPFGYNQESGITTVDQSSLGPCTFPFSYNGKRHSACVLDDNQQPICGLNSNTRFYCQNSSIEGVRRVFPKYQLLNNLFQATHVPASRTIDISFLYASCMSPSLVQVLPPNFGQVLSIANASKQISGHYSMMFDGQTYSPIPAATSGTNLGYVLQLFPNFGYVTVNRTGDCHQYRYTIEWLATGEQPLISIANSSQVRPINAPMTVSSIRRGSTTHVYYGVPNDILRTYHTTPQVEVLVGGYPSVCTRSNNSCEFQWSINQTPEITSVVQTGTTVVIHGNGFSNQSESNMVRIGESGSCAVQTATPTMIRCTITNAPAGTHVLQLNIADKGLASTNGTFLVHVPLTVSSFDPNGGDAGGGYPLFVFGNGFSYGDIVFVGENLCINTTVINFTTIRCTVPPSSSGGVSQVRISVSNGLNTAAAATQFSYNSTTLPTIVSISPTYVGVQGGIVHINGSGFGNQGVSVLVGTKSVFVLTASNNFIAIQLNARAPGLYPIQVGTSTGFARPLVHIEYRFYIQRVTPQVGSAYGGTELFVQGVGFETGTSIQLRDRNDEISSCDTISLQSNLINCRTKISSPQVTITSYGTHPTLGFGYSWFPVRETVQQGANVTWHWDATQLNTPVPYKIQQVANAYSTVPVTNGFDSGAPSSIGSFSHTFDKIGSYYYWAPNVHPASGYSMRGVIEVIAVESKTLTVEAVWNGLPALKCAFPFIFNSMNYTACTTANDTQLWCSPTPIFTGLKLYCSPTASLPVSACSSNPLNASSCSETVPTASNPDHFLSTTCTVESVLSISPAEGPVGTILTITGTGFEGSFCEYDIQIGSSYHCPIINMSSTELVCQITPLSMLDPQISHIVRVSRKEQGYLANENQLKFQFQSSISSISPMIGSISGGTVITIDGDGFITDRTITYIQNANHIYRGSLSYSRIVFETTPELTLTDLDLPLTVYVGTTVSICLIQSCHFSWATSVTPHFRAVSPSLIQGTTNLTISGENLLCGGNNSSGAHVVIDGHACNITVMTNDSITCSVSGVKAGTHPIEGSINGIGNISSGVNVTADAIISTVTPLTSGIHGGAILNIDGHGFSTNESEVHVYVGPNPCPVIEANEDHIECIIPDETTGSNVAPINVTSHEIPFPSPFTVVYNESITANVTSVSPNSGSGSQALVITGENFVGVGQTNVTVGQQPCSVSAVSMTSITCTVSQNLPAGNHTVQVNVEEIGNSNGNVNYRHDLSVSAIVPSTGGYGGGIPAAITGNGFNGTSVTVTVCNASCSSVRIDSNNQLTCVIPSMPLSVTDTTCNVTVNVDGIIKITQYTYRASLTPSVTSISPNRGGTAGGTLVTINGTGFPNSLNSVTVSIGGTPCSIQSVTSTMITCETGVYRQSIVRVPVMVFINGSGYAAGMAFYQYIDLWSSQWTWGGQEPPEAGTISVIENQATVFLDIETPLLKVLVIDNATLIFEDSQDVTLNVEYIVIVNGGRLQVGTEQSPFEHRGIINLHGHLRSIELPIFGAKVLALREGTLDMHGKPTGSTWGRLAATAINGSSTITLLQPVLWPIDSQIVIATTSNRFSQRESELRRIKNISANGLVLTLDKPLVYTHLGISHTVNSVALEIRAEVGLLSHNVVFRGSVTETWDEQIEACPTGFNPDEFAVQTCFLGRYGPEVGSDEFGATIMVSHGANTTNGNGKVVVRLSNVEVFHVGQAFRLDRYAIHFQDNGNMSESYIRSSSIHESYNRAVYIRATNYITVADNVIYNIMGNAMFLSDGIEIGNVFRRNLAIFVRASSSLINEDLTPAAFWLTNPNNIVESNAVAGCSHYGYWYRLDEKVGGLDRLTHSNYCPHRQPFGIFYNNSVHSTGRFGVWIYPEYGPTLTGDCNGTDPTSATIDSLVAWKNNKGIEVVNSRTIHIKNAVVFDNADMGIGYITAVGHQDTNPPYIRPSFYDSTNGSSIVDSIIIGDAGLSSDPITPTTAGLVVMWDRGLRINNIQMINFPSNQTPAISGPIILDRCTDRCGGWLTKFSNMSFSNVLIRGRYRWAYDGLYYDEDGSLGGMADYVIMPPDGLTNRSSSCISVPAFENALQCPRSQGDWLRFSFREILERPLGRLFVYNDGNASTIVPWLPDQLTYPNGYLVVLKANQTYQLEFETSITSDSMRYTGVIYDVAPGDYLIIQHNMTAVPFKANTTIDRQMILGNSMPLSGSTSTNGDWYYDHQRAIFSYIIKNPLTSNSSMDIELSYQIYVCPCNGCGCPPTTTTSTTTTTTSSATTATTTSVTTVTTTSVTTTTTTSATTTTATTTTSVTTTSVTTTSATTTTTSSSTTATTTTTTSTIYLPPIQPCLELPTNFQVCQMIYTVYWSIDSHWTFGPQDYSNWLGHKPGDDNNIFVPRCYWLIVDYPLPRIRSFTIEGVVEFQQGRNHVLQADSIIINGGRLIVGLPNAPFNGTADIIMTNNRPLNVQYPLNFPRVGPKMIAVLGGLDLHGKPRIVSWTRLAVTASSGQNTIVLSQSVDWNIGDEIIITTTDKEISHTERHVIANIRNSSILETRTPLAYTHVVIRNIFPNGQMISVAAAVGLLTRNVRVINQNSNPSMSGFRIHVATYQTPIWHIHTIQHFDTCYKGYLRVTNTQFQGFGQFDDSYETDQKAGIYFNGIGDYEQNRATYVQSSVFDGGFNAAISFSGTNSIPIRSNIIFNTYRSGLVITGKNNIINNNLVASIFWLGTGQSFQVAEFNFNTDGAIMSRTATSVRMTDNLVAGVERIAYRIQGETCGGSNIFVPANITNEYSNNEAHAAMSGVNLFPSDPGFTYDRSCVLIKGFKVYKGWYYGFYINNPRNITISSCASIDSQVGIFTYIIGPSAVSHTIIGSRVTINNSVIIGSITPNDCNDTIDQNTLNIRLSKMAVPGVYDNSSFNGTIGRSGIVFPVVSRNNFMPIRSWTGTGIYPCLSGLMTITNTTLAFFDDTCGRHDVAIQVSQKNDDGQFPISTSSMFVYNTTPDNIIYNGKPNLAVVNPSRCGDMDCDGLKKNLITDMDGSIFGVPTSAFSHAEVRWGSQQHGIGDYRIPRVAYTNLTGHRMNINLTHPYRGISRTNSCSLSTAWGMYMCNSTTNYRMLIIESMDSDTEKRRISPVAVMSKSGYIDLLNGPQDQTTCQGYSCRKRISTFMAIVQSHQTYEIYFSSNPPRHLRFRLLNADPSIKCIIAVYYLSVQQIDVYANTIYIAPTNRDLRVPNLILLNQPNGVTYSSAPGSNYFDRTYQMAYFLIDGNATIEIKVSPLLILTFGFPPMDPAAFFAQNVVNNLALLLGVSQDRIRRVNIISASNNTRIKRQAVVANVRVQLEIRDEPRQSTTAVQGIRGELLANIAARIINRYQAYQLQPEFVTYNLANGNLPTNLSVQEPYDDFEAELSVIYELVIIIPPSDCREHSPCTIQPVLIAYDGQGNVIDKLGSNDRPWQVQASLVAQPNVVLAGGIANYTNGQTQYTLLSLPGNGTYQVQFTIILPDGVNTTIFMTRNLTAVTAPILVNPASLAGVQVNNIYVVNVNATFSVSVMPVDSVTMLRIGQIQWNNWRWTAQATLYSLPNFNRQGSLITSNTSRVVINATGITVTITGLSIDVTGMYMLDIRLTSTNNEHNIRVISNGILVKNSSGNFVTDINAFSSSMTFLDDYDALNASNGLEIKRVMIYNYLLNIGMPLISDIVLIRGSTGNTIALFEVDPLPTSVSNAVSTLLSNLNAINGLTISSININTRIYSAPEQPTTNQESSGGSNNTILIAVLSSVLGTGCLVAVVSIVIYQANQTVPTNNAVGPVETPPSPPQDAVITEVEIVAEPPPEPAPVQVSQYFNPSETNASTMPPVDPSTEMELLIFE